MGQGELTWDALDSYRKQAELGLTEGWADVTRRFLKTDDHVLSTYTTYVAAIAGSRRELIARKVPPEYTAIAAAQAEACEEMLNSLPNIERSIGELIDADFTGWAMEEIIWQPRADWLMPVALEWLHPDRFRFSQRFVPFLWDKGMAISRAKELGLSLDAADGLGLPLPANKYIVHMPRLIPDYPQGSGIFLAIMRPWFVKNWCTKFALAGAEIAGNPRMLGVLPDQAVPDVVRQELYNALQNLSAESVGVVSGGTTIEILDPKMTGNGGVWDYLLKRCDAAISKAILGSTLNVEVGDSGGNRSLGESQADMTISPRWARSSVLVANTIESQLLKPFLELNRHHFGGHVFVPQLRLHITEDEPSVDQLAVDSEVVSKDELRRSRKLEPWGKEKGGDDIVRGAGRQFDAQPSTTSPAHDSVTASDPQAVDPTTALNGAQVSSLMEIVTAVATRQIPRETGVALITAAFPIDTAAAERLMGPVGQSFFVSPEGAPVAAPAVGVATPLPFSASRALLDSRLAELSRSLTRSPPRQRPDPVPLPAKRPRLSASRTR